MVLVFLHGAGGYDDDRLISGALGEELGVEVWQPRLPEEDMSVEAWAAPTRQALGEMSAGDYLVGHSFGATILLSVLAERPRSVPARVLLLAMPDWGATGWGVPEYEVNDGEPPQRLSLHHCRDDEVVPFAHLGHWAVRLPSAQLHGHESGGHQFEGLTGDLAADLTW